MILPDLFSRRMMKILDQEFDAFQQSFDNEIATSIRINSSKYQERTLPGTC